MNDVYEMFFLGERTTVITVGAGGLGKAIATSLAAGGANVVYVVLRLAWKLEGGKMIYEVTVPPNTTATVMLSGGKAGEVMMNGNPVSGTS